MTQKSSLTGKVALVTGGGTGIGRAIALALAARGVHVLVTGPEERAVAEVVGEIANSGAKARHLAGDVRDPEHLRAAVKKAVDTFGSLDLVVANARQSGRVELGDLPNAEAILKTNLLGVYYTFHAAAEAISAGGRMIAISKGLATSGVGGLVRSLAVDLAARKISCNAVCPGDAIEPEDVGEYVVFLCSDAGRAITGQMLAIGGGDAS